MDDRSAYRHHDRANIRSNGSVSPVRRAATGRIFRTARA